VWCGFCGVGARRGPLTHPPAPHTTKAQVLRRLRQLELRQTEANTVHFVDLYVSTVVFLYRRYQRSLDDISLRSITGKLAITIQQCFPTIATIEETNGLVASNFALVFVQSRYRARMLRKAYKGAEASGDYASFKELFKMHQKRIAK
jgi:hypothetical protein